MIDKVQFSLKFTIIFLSYFIWLWGFGQFIWLGILYLFPFFNSQTGNLLISMWWFLVIPIAGAPLLTWRTFNKISGIRSLSYFLAGLLFVFLIGHINMGFLHDISRNPERIKILTQQYGKSIDLCQVIELGMTDSDVIEILGEPSHLGRKRNISNLNDQYYRIEYPPKPPIPHESIILRDNVYRQIIFETKTNKVAEVECFDRTFIKSPDASGLTNYTYRK